MGEKFSKNLTGVLILQRVPYTIGNTLSGVSFEVLLYTIDATRSQSFGSILRKVFFEQELTSSAQVLANIDQKMSPFPPTSS